MMHLVPFVLNNETVGVKVTFFCPIHVLNDFI